MSDFATAMENFYSKKRHCLYPNCTCQEFQVLSSSRYCQCGHDCIDHFVSEIKSNELLSQTNSITHETLFEIGTFILKNTNTINIRSHILLDLLFSFFASQLAETILFINEWSMPEYTRGYKFIVSTPYQYDFLTERHERLVMLKFAQIHHTKTLAMEMLKQMNSINELEARSYTISENGLLAYTTQVGLDQPANYSTTRLKIETTGPKINVKTRTNGPDMTEQNKSQIASSTSTPGTTLENIVIKLREEEGIPVCDNIQFVNADLYVGLLKPKRSKLDKPERSSMKKDRRVLCEMCKQTYCDKGALKIHISAVHQKEKHTCLYKSCTKMFSSRRSRNRHSSNKNPFLHGFLTQEELNNATLESPTVSEIVKD